MQSFLISAGVVAVSEIGDKTQLLALILASRFRRPVPIILGILTATLANHALAGFAGEWLAGEISPRLLQWALGVTFIAMAAWSLIPDKMDDAEVGLVSNRSAYIATAVSFFIAEIGDKTQLATAALAAHFQDLLPVVMGTTLGMLVADVPAVYGGYLAGNRLNLKYMRYTAAGIFAAFGVYTFL